MENDDGVAIFEWDEAKNLLNQTKHGVSFRQARHAFTDPARLIFADLDHSLNEDRFFCLGMAGAGAGADIGTVSGVMTVRFTYRDKRIRIFGAGYWSKGKRIYDDERRSLH